MHAQLRHAQDMHTWWALGDGKWAFDVASRHAMLIGVYEAGVHGPEWLLLDDVMAQENQCLALHGMLSCVFQFKRGTAQGRRFSVPVFNSQLRDLADDIADVLPQGCSTVAPPFAREALLRAAEEAPPAQFEEPPRAESTFETIERELSRLASAKLPPWPQSGNFVLGVLQALPSLADRVAVLGRLGAFRMPPAQFVDAITTPCPSLGATRAVVSEEEWSACSRYARRVKARFNYERGTTAVLPNFERPEAGCGWCARAAIEVSARGAGGCRPHVSALLTRYLNERSGVV